MKKGLALLFAVSFLDLLSFSLILPLLPYYAEHFGASPFIIGALTAAYAIGQVIGAPIIGRLSDRYGRKPLLLLSVAGSAASFLVMGVSQSLTALFAARLLGGLFGGNITVVQAYIADISDEADRAKRFGLIGAAFGLGFIFGPPAGGLLSASGYAVPALAAAGLEALTLVLIAAVLPESLTSERKAELRVSPRSRFSMKLLWEAVSDPRIGKFLHLRIFTALAFLIFQTNYALFAQQRLGYDAKSTGLSLAFVGLLVAVFQGGLIGPLVKRFDEHRLFAAGALLSALGLAAWAFTPSTAWLLISLVPMSLGQGLVTTLNRSLITKAVDPAEIGGTLGLLSSVESGINILAPLIGGVLIGSIGTWAPGLLSAVLMLWSALFIVRRFAIAPQLPLAEGSL
jgi:DHA1 family tetracycline resistance protein-like MFS transporter